MGVRDAVVLHTVAVQAGRKLLHQGTKLFFGHGRIVAFIDDLTFQFLVPGIRGLLEPGGPAFTVNVLSFGYKTGIPSEADLVFDVRCLPNPYYDDALRDLTGLDPAVAEYVWRDGTAQKLLDRLTELLLFLAPLYEADRPELTVGVGCTGGRHRSVAVAQALADALEGAGLAVTVAHRDRER